MSINYKRRANSFEIPVWVNQPNVSKGCLDVFHSWTGLRNLKWKGDEYERMNDFHGVLKTIVYDIGQDDFINEIGHVEFSRYRLIRNTTDRYMSGELGRYDRVTVLDGDEHRSFPKLLRSMKGPWQRNGRSRRIAVATRIVSTLLLSLISGRVPKRMARAAFAMWQGAGDSKKSAKKNCSELTNAEKT